ncbi:MAG: PSD1 domain-containing protein [Planctomyces sp.]|nr:PSD1 domain-containing protein [Planctomyces sp.]
MALIILSEIAGFGTSANESGLVRADEFRSKILPILAENCFSCHGPDAANRKADLRLDQREDALKVLSLEDPDAGEFLKRITSSDPDLMMPPPGANRKPIHPHDVDLLRRWIGEGAQWSGHWSLSAPVRPTVPGLAPHPIDAFVLHSLNERGLSLSKPASRTTLARRLAFDLTGMLPPKEQIDEFLKSESQDAVEHYIDQLLNSPHHGERLAMWWLDAARYADTDGFQQDATRTNWPWRDWVIEAFNSNMPFDQFTIHQFAGDLIPEANSKSRLATAFHRNHMTNGEGGRDPEESRVDYVIDRTNSIGSVWLGVTLGCCQCHSHKYDPISHDDYYRLAAFFNSIDETGKAGREAGPYLSVESSTVARALEESDRWLQRRSSEEVAAKASAEPRFQQWLKELWQLAAEEPQRLVAWTNLPVAALESTEGTTLTADSEQIIQASGKNPVQDDYRVVIRPGNSRITGIRLEVFPHTSHTQGRFSRGRAGHFVLTDVKVQVREQGSSQVRDLLIDNAVADTSDDPAKYEGYGSIKHVLDDDPRNGWSIRDADQTKPHVAVFALAEPLLLHDTESLVFELRMRSTLGDANMGRFRVSVSDQAGSTVRSVEQAPIDRLREYLSSGASQADLPDHLLQALREQFLADHEAYLTARRNLDLAARQKDEIASAQKVDVMVLAERKDPRATHVLIRGVWDKPGTQVSAGIPSAIGGWTENAAPDRLGLARWLVSEQNPLTARVVVNHFWQMMFGQGLVRTVEDFGVQGEPPTHPELLDWLAVEFVESGWNIRHLLRLMVTSQTYQQTSVISPDLRMKDPENRWLARSHRFRVPSWMLRDNVLSTSGLLNPAIGGPPIRPWQPPGVWEENFMGRFRYEPSQGPAQYRRTIYAFWRRAVAPTFLFDSAQRRVCEVRSNRTNTPLHALTLLNDVGYLEAARAIAEATITQQNSESDRIQKIAERILLRRLNEQELSPLLNTFNSTKLWYQDHPDDALAFLQACNPNDLFVKHSADTHSSDDSAQLAAFVVTAASIYNLDEAITHE